MHRPATKLTSAVRQLARWYLTPTGAAFALAVIVGAVLAAAVSLPVGLLVVVVAVALIVPYKLMRLEQGRVQALDGVRQAKDATRYLHDSVNVVGVRVAAAEQQLIQVRDAMRSESEHWDTSLPAFKAELAERLDAHDTDVEALRTSHAEQRDAHDTDVEALRTSLAEQRDAYDAALSRHRSQLALSLARRDGRSRPVRRAILLICAPRVGSTWLFDLLRQHPSIDVHPTADIFRRLAVTGRRYPTHLTDVVDAGLEVEVGEQIGGVISAFSTLPAAGDDGGGQAVDPYFIEKLHPSFVAFDVDGFAGRVAALRAELGGDDRVAAVYPIREPSESIRSFMAYQRRNPDWSQDVPLALVHDYYRRSYESLAALHERLPGPVVTYEELTRDPAGTVATLFRRLGVQPVDEPAIAGYVHATAAQKAGAASDFFSSGNDEPGIVDVELGTGSDDPAQARESLARCRQLYRVLVDRDTAERAAINSAAPGPGG